MAEGQTETGSIDQYQNYQRSQGEGLTEEEKVRLDQVREKSIQAEHELDPTIRHTPTPQPQNLLRRVWGKLKRAYGTPIKNTNVQERHGEW